MCLKAKKIYKEVQEQFPGWIIFSQGQMNRLGYQYINGDLSKALAIFRFNTKAHPDHWNV